MRRCAVLVALISLVWVPASAQRRLSAAPVYDRVVVKTVEHAALLSLPSTAVQIGPTPAAGTVIVPTLAILSLNDAAGAYGNVWEHAVLTLSKMQAIGIGDATSAAFTSPLPDWLTQQVVPWTVGEGRINTQFGTAADYGPLLLGAVNDTFGDFTGGHPNNVLRVTVVYVVYDLATGQLIPAP